LPQSCHEQQERIQIQNGTGILDLPAFLSIRHWYGRGCNDTNVEAGTARPEWVAVKSALAGNGDVFAAGRMAAVFACLRHRAGDFVRIDASIGRGLREIPRLTIGLRGMGAALFALGKALVDAIAVGLIGNNENPAVGPRCRPDKKTHAGQKP
jgi:hypothetical protein